MNVGIVGAEAKKFTEVTEAAAKALINELLTLGDTLVSGGCHLGGVDIWAEKAANEMGLDTIIYYPKIRRWGGGYRERNLRIARDSYVVHNIIVAEYPPGYIGLRFTRCYHCNTHDHVKSGGCWTANKALRAERHIIYPDGTIKSEEI